MSNEVHEKLKSLIGLEGPLQVCVDDVSKEMVRHFCDAINDQNPLYTDEEYGKKSKWGTNICPPGMMYTWTHLPLNGPTGQLERYDEELGEKKDTTDPLSVVIETLENAGYDNGLSADITYEFVKPVLIGDRVSAREKLIAVSDEKKTRVGTGFFTTYVRTYWNRKGEVVCKHQYVNYKYKGE